MEGEKHPPSPFQDDMVFEILTWLPAKSLMRFKCVSKAWNNLIRCNLNFVKLHIARSQTHPQATRLLFQIRIKKPYPYVLKLGLEQFPLLERFPLQLVRPHNYFEVGKIIICSNHCNGLVCLYDRKEFQGYLYNTTTGEMKALPFSLGYTKKWVRPKLYLGYDPDTERYKLLRHFKKRPSLDILTLGTNSWRRIRDESPCELYSDCIFLNGVLYWAEHVHSMIVYFNLTEEKFGTLSPPQKCGASQILTALWGKLILHHPDEPLKCNWVYDEVNKVFKKFDSNPDLEKGKVAFLEAENIDKRTYQPKYILTTSSLISTSTSLVFSHHFQSARVSKFVENIVPLTFIDV